MISIELGSDNINFTDNKENGDEEVAIRISSRKQKQYDMVLSAMETGQEYSSDYFCDIFGLKVSRVKVILNELTVLEKIEKRGTNRFMHLSGKFTIPEKANIGTEKRTLKLKKRTLDSKKRTLKRSRSSALLKEMLEKGIIYPISGHGKGKYRFRDIEKH